MPSTLDFPHKNEAKYEALIAGLRISKELCIRHLNACNDF